MNLLFILNENNNNEIIGIIVINEKDVYSFSKLYIKYILENILHNIT